VDKCDKTVMSQTAISINVANIWWYQKIDWKFNCQLYKLC